ncbi:hypothetical protein WI40_16875 [Burkholderia ubonensis]|nr:hypothetical protein WI40_16875 [Burkholderia ubonensis]
MNEGIQRRARRLGRHAAAAALAGALTDETPTGRPQFHAKKEVPGPDLHEPWFRTVESYDNDGRLFEQIVIEKIAPASFDEAAFDPKNPAYAF